MRQLRARRAGRKLVRQSDRPTENHRLQWRLFLPFNFEKQSTFMSTNSEYFDQPDAAPLLGQPRTAQPSTEWHETPDAPQRLPWLMPFRNGLFTTGFILLVCSMALFALYTYVLRDAPASPDMGMFFLHYAVAITYAATLMTNGIFKFRVQTAVESRAARWTSLLLFLVSAFALNRDFAVFQQSTEWLCVALVGAGATMTAYAWTPWLGVRMQQIVYFSLAMSVWLFGYAAVTLAPMYPVGLIGLLLLGMSVHLFIPVLLATTLGRRLVADYRTQEHLRPAIWAGFSLPPTVVFLFLIAWSQCLERVSITRDDALLRRTSDLPDWVLMAQRIDGSNPVTRYIMNQMLGVGMHYDEGPTLGGAGLMGSMTVMDDVKVHDPLVVIANRLLPPPDLSREDKVSLLRAINNDRHNTEEKFWSGRHLTTQSLVSQARIWPQFRLAYTEKTIRVRNAAETQTGEALYTFHLPTGSVITSMSLWINGREEKARLTTVAKADSAYGQVVNVESRIISRDPAVVYWQEGGRVTLRVYPCPAGQERQVKLGVTSPLRLDGTELVYENPWFEGPTANGAQETVQVDFDQQPTGLVAPHSFDRGPGSQLTHRGTYTPGWSLRMRAPALSGEPFVLNGVAFRLSPYQPKTESFNPERVYLDLNAAWSLAEFEQVWQGIRHRPVFVFDDGFVALTESNRAAYFEKLGEQSISLFPIYRDEHPERALLVTQSGGRSLFLSDLKTTTFAEHLTEHAAHQLPLHVLNLSTETAGYLKTLSEFGALRMVTTTAEVVRGGIRKASFPVLEQNATTVALPEAGVVCQATPVGQTQTASVGPDHLARLFGYNHLLSGIGRQYFDASFKKNDALLMEAQTAHVLSPLSSLIVLETEADYDRFGIKKDANGLQNATLKDEGAVPEPHEWAMIVLFGLGLIWLKWRNKSRWVGSD